jgi:hypothetical protein
LIGGDVEAGRKIGLDFLMPVAGGSTPLTVTPDAKIHGGKQ